MSCCGKLEGINEQSWRSYKVLEYSEIRNIVGIILTQHRNDHVAIARAS